MSEEVGMLANAAGDARVVFSRRADGMFTWVELGLVRVDPVNDPWVTENCWTPSTRHGGIYVDLASARAEALAEIHWLREV